MKITSWRDEKHYDDHDKDHDDAGGDDHDFHGGHGGDHDDVSELHCQLRC